MLRIKGEGLAVIHDGSLFHALFFALLPHNHILRGKALEELLLLLLLFILLSYFFAQPLVLCLKLVHPVQLFADETLGKRLLDVITTVDGKEEVIESRLHIAPVKGLDGIMILLVGLTLGKRSVDGALVVVMTGKLLDIIAHENITLTQRLLKTDALETGAAGQGNIRLSARKDTTREINLHLVEGEALALMNRYRPSQTDGVLLVSANLFLLNLFLNLIEMVSHVAPCRRLHHHILAFLGAHINLGIFILIKTDDGAQRAIHPLMLDIILDEDNLSPRLEVKFDRGRETALRKLALYVATEEARLSRKTLELAVVNVIYRIAACREGDGKFGIALIELGSHTLVEAL